MDPNPLWIGGVEPESTPIESVLDDSVVLRMESKSDECGTALSPSGRVCEDHGSGSVSIGTDGKVDVGTRWRCTSASTTLKEVCFRI